MNTDILKQNPYPSGWEPTIWQKLWSNLTNYISPETQEKLWNVFVMIRNFFDEYLAWIFLILAILSILILIISSLKRRQKNIEKLWRFILFFLSKRQMMIPLVYTLADRDQILDKIVSKKLLLIRDKCRSLPLRKSPDARLREEIQVSQILAEYFFRLDQEGKIKSGSKFEKVSKDLEFIDQKLIELQKIYNQESLQWNKVYGIFPLNFIGRILGFHSFELFGK